MAARWKSALAASWTARGLSNSTARPGVFSRDTRPIKTFDGFRFTKPGFHFVRLIEPVSGIEALSNAVYVSEDEPAWRIYWGDPHFPRAQRRIAGPGKTLRFRSP